MLNLISKLLNLDQPLKEKYNMEKKQEAKKETLKLILVRLVSLTKLDYDPPAVVKNILDTGEFFYL